MKQQGWIRLTLMVAAYLALIGGVVQAAPIDEAGAKLSAFVQSAGAIMTGLIPAVGGLAVAGLAVKRALAKVMGEEESMVRANNQIVEVLKLTAIGTGSALVVAVAASVLV